jgi:hypothetical protein
MSDLLGGFRPSSPPPELRGRVLAAAREAAATRPPGLLELLLADRALRVCLAFVTVLLAAHVLVDGAPELPAPSPRPAIQDEASVPAESGLTATEQAEQLEPSL